MTEAERLHSALCTATAKLAAVVEDARFEGRDGGWFVSFPTFPLPSFNGIWAETDAAAASLGDAMAEIEPMGLRFGAQVRAGRTPAVEEAARRHGLTVETRIPGMAVEPDELDAATAVPELDVVRVATADGLAQALAIAAGGFEVPAELLAAMYLVEVAALEGLEYYLGRVEGRDVATAIGYRLEGTVGIFNVATPREHRGRGYGAAVTAEAARDGFSAGAELAWLQSSAIGESVYRRLGFREVETYVLLTRPSAT
jgi:ribosomal protein S18 acetylase RimI-like enzyme